ncbi:MAG: folate-binding protein [Opitutaceae bacterium]
MAKYFREFLGWSRFQPAAWVRVTGEDALVFLQGQFTQDLVKTPDGGVAYGVWLTPKGRVMGDSLILRVSAQELWIYSEGFAGPALCARLEAYIVADDVVLEDRTAGATAVVFYGVRTDGERGERAAEPDDCDPGRGRRIEGGAVLRGSGRRAGLGVVVHDDPGVSVAAPPGAAWTKTDAERWRSAQGLVRVPEDVGPGEFPNEGGLEHDAISYTKGCYLGQETVARLKTFAQVRRVLRPVAGKGPVPAGPGLPLFQGAKRVGELRTTVDDGTGGFVGFALLTVAAWDPSAGLSRAEGAQPDLTVTG